VRRHLTTARGGVCRRSNRLQEHIRRRHAEREAEGTIPIVRKEPVDARTKGQSRTHLKSLVTGTGDLKEDLLLSLEQNLAIINPA